jgi:hypothetical protein
MSLNGTQTNIYPNSLDGLQTNNVDSIYINGQIFDPTNLVPYTNSIKDLDMGSNNIKTSHEPTANDDVVNLLTLQNAVTYIDGINVANFVRYAESNANTDLGTYTISSSTAPTTGNNLTNKTYVDTQDALKVPYTGATSNLNLGSNTITASTAKFTAITSATPTLALGVDALGNLNTFAVPSSGGIGGTVSTRYIPYASGTNTLANSLFNQIDNDSMGFGYTAIPNYPLGSSKNMYVNGSIFAGGLNSMVGTFGRDTNTSNPANEITFVAGGAGILLTQVKSHSGSSGFVDATWTYSNTNPAPLGANQGQVLLQADKLTMALTNGLAVSGTITISTPSGGPGFVHTNGTITVESYVGGSVNAGWYGTRTNHPLCFYTNNSSPRLTIDTAGNASFTGNVTVGVSKRLILDGTGATEIYNGQVDTYNPTGNNNLMIRSWWGIGFPSYDNIVRIGMDTRTGNAGFSGTVTAKNITIANGDDSMANYGPNSTWSAYLTVGSGTDKSGASRAQVISTNGNLHLDGGNGNDIYYGYYPNSRGTPNIHRWYGDNYNFVNVPQNYVNYAQVCVFVGDQMRRSQAMQRQLVNYYGGWGGGYNMTYAFYKQNTKVPVRLHGHYSGWWSSSYMGYAMIRIYNQTNGVYITRILPTFTNNGGNHITIPFDQVFTDGELTTTGWYDVYMYNYAGINTDYNDVLTVNCTLLPVDYF